MHPDDARPTRSERAAAATALALLQTQPCNYQGNRNRAIVLLTVLVNPSIHVRALTRDTGLSVAQVTRAVCVLHQANLLSKRTSSAESLKIQCCYVTVAGHTFIKEHILPTSDSWAIPTPSPRPSVRSRRNVFRNTVHPTLLDRQSYLAYRRARQQSDDRTLLDRFALSLILFLGEHSTLEATWYQAELYPRYETRRSKAKHQAGDPDTLSRKSVRDRFGAAVRRLSDLNLIKRWPDPESKKTAWMFQKLPGLDRLYEGINQSLRSKT